MKRLIKRNLSIIIPTLCMVFVIGIAFLVSVRSLEGREISYDFSVRAGGETVYARGYEKKDGKYIPISEDACFMLPVTDEGINDVRIIFSEPFDSDCRIKLSYISEKDGESVCNSTETEVKRGYNEYFCQIPYGKYTALECYIPREVGIDSVILSNVLSSETVRIRKLDTSRLVWILAPAFLTYASVLAAAFITRKRKNLK